jgi:hypothetical protein
VSRGEFSYKIRSFWFNHFVRCFIRGCFKHRDYWGHHIIRQSAGGPWEEWNKLPICREHHTELHAIGEEAFMEKYPETRAKIEKAHEIWRKKSAGEL